MATTASFKLNSIPIKPALLPLRLTHNGERYRMQLWRQGNYATFRCERLRGVILISLTAWKRLDKGLNR